MGLNTSKCAKKVDLASLKSNVHKLVIDKLKNVQTGLNSLKSKVDELDVDSLVPVPLDLSKLNDSVKTNVFKKDVYNAKIKNIEDKIPDISNLATKTILNAKINVVKNKIANITNSATTTTALTAFENKIPNVNNLVKKLTITQKLVKLKQRLLIMVMINILLLLKLTSENFAARLAQGNLATKSNIANFAKKTYFDDKLKKLNKKKYFKQNKTFPC